MIFSDKLQILRKSQGMTQENLAEKLQISRQAVAKWENGMAYPDILNLIQLSELFNITIDYLVKDNQCSKSLEHSCENDMDELIEFRLEANKNTYAGYAVQCSTSRPESHDYAFEKGDYWYYDTSLVEKSFQERKLFGKREKRSMQ